MGEAPVDSLAMASPFRWRNSMPSSARAAQPGKDSLNSRSPSFLQLPFTAQHRLKTNAGQERLQRRLGQSHHRGLRLGRGTHLGRPACPPELQHPRCNFQRITRRHRQWPQRIKQPFRRLANDARRGQWEDIGEGKSPGIAAEAPAAGPSLSITCTRKPRACAARATDSPITPAPTTTTVSEAITARSTGISWFRGAVAR